MKIPGVLALLVGLLAGASGMARSASIEEGRPFPDLRLPSLRDGKLRSITGFAGKKTLLLVFASW